MKRIIFATVLFASALSLFACVTTPPPHEPKPTAAEEPVTAGQKAKPLIKCSTCGVEFTTREEAEEHMKAHPEHKVAPTE